MFSSPGLGTSFKSEQAEQEYDEVSIEFSSPGLGTSFKLDDEDRFALMDGDGFRPLVWGLLLNGVGGENS